MKIDFSLCFILYKKMLSLSSLDVYLHVQPIHYLYDFQCFDVLRNLWYIKFRVVTHIICPTYRSPSCDSRGILGVYTTWLPGYKVLDRFIGSAHEMRETMDGNCCHVQIYCNSLRESIRGVPLIMSPWKNHAPCI